MSLVRLGEVLQFQEPDYQFGVGPLTLRVTHVANTSSDPEWIELRGMQISTLGHDVTQRTVLVRRTAIEGARKKH